MFSAPLIYVKYFFIVQRDPISGSRKAELRRVNVSAAEINERAWKIIYTRKSFNVGKKCIGYMEVS